MRLPAHLQRDLKQSVGLIATWSHPSPDTDTQYNPKRKFWHPNRVNRYRAKYLWQQVGEVAHLVAIGWKVTITAVHKFEKLNQVEEAELIGHCDKDAVNEHALKIVADMRAAGTADSIETFEFKAEILTLKQPPKEAFSFEDGETEYQLS